MPEYESRSTSTATARKTHDPGVARANPRKPTGGMLGMCRILDGRPRGRGRAEISIETIHHPEIAVGMKGILMASEATLEIIAVRPGVAKATLQGKGVEKLSYRGWMAVIEPDESFRATNANASQLTPTADGAAGRRLLGAK